MQKCLELQKCGVEEKLERSNKRCEELEENLERSERRCDELEAKVNKLRQKLNKSSRKCEELRRKEIEAESRIEETNWDVDGLRAEKKKDFAQLHMSRNDDLKPTVKEKENNVLSSGGELRNEETTITQVLNLNHVTGNSAAAAEEDGETLNVLEMDENGKRKANVGDAYAFSPEEVCGNSEKFGGNRGIGLSREAAATAEGTPNVPESDENGKHKVNVGDGDGDAF